MYSKKYDIVFIHIPKCAGTAICKSLSIESGHYKYSQIKSNLIKNNLRSFAVVRNPYDRLVSIYEYFKMKKSYWHSNDGSTTYGLLRIHKWLEDKNFKMFVKELVQNYDFIFNMGCLHVEPQYKYVIDNQDQLVKPLICKFENLEEDISRILETEIEIPKINSSNRKKDWTEYYDEETQNLVYNFYKQDFDLFDYSFSI